MAIDNNEAINISDVRVDGGVVPSRADTTSSLKAVSPSVLPIRGEKRIIPTPVSPADATTVFSDQYTKSGQPVPQRMGRQLVEHSDYFLKAAMGPYIDYVYIRLPHRGITADKTASGDIPAIYRFLINPSQVSVARTTLDAQAMTRAGWQIGVWGEDSLQITLTGKTAGQYWSFGVTDRYQQFTESYRNLQMLQVVFENNGYWFEGEEIAEGPLAADFARRRIKMHQDVELTVGNFTWYGMFESLTITQSAEEPWLASFTLNFVAWKERFRNGSPYQNLIPNDVQRGHSYQAWIPAAPKNLNGVPSNARNLGDLLPPVQVATPGGLFETPQFGVQSAVETSLAQQPNLDFCTTPSAVDWSPAPTRLFFTSHPELLE